MDRVGLPTAVITPQTIIATRLRRPDAATIVEPARPRITGHIADRLPPGLAARFELAEQLGVGGEARVYRAIRRPDGREVAVKVFGPGIVPRYLYPLGSPQHRRAFSPAHSVEVYERVSEDGCHVEVMEYCGYGTLAGFVNARGLQGRLLAEVIEQTATALLAMHPVVHGDVKPSNILIRRLEPLQLVLSDFGLSTDLGDRSRVTNVGLGSRVYMAPEADASLRPACDWWSLGISIVELATGWHPMRRPDGSWPTIPELSRMLSAPIDLSGIGDGRVRQLVRGLLVHDHRQRWGDAEVARWLAGGNPVVARGNGGFEARLAPRTSTSVSPRSPSSISPTTVDPLAGRPDPSRPPFDGQLKEQEAPQVRRTRDPRRGAPLRTRVLPATGFEARLAPRTSTSVSPQPSVSLPGAALVPAPMAPLVQFSPPPVPARRRFSLSAMVGGLVGIGARSILTVLLGSMLLWGMLVPGLASTFGAQPIIMGEYLPWLLPQLGISDNAGIDPAIIFLIGSGLVAVFTVSCVVGVVRAVRGPTKRVRWTLLGGGAALGVLMNLPALVTGGWNWAATNPSWQYWALALPALGRLVDQLRTHRRR